MPVNHDTEGASAEFMARFNALLAERYGPEPRWAYFQRANGPMFCWTTEPNPGDGKYASFVYRPVGKGARSGKATTWKLVESGKWKIVEHSKRRLAKARALRLFEADRSAA